MCNYYQIKISKEALKKIKNEALILNEKHAEVLNEKIEKFMDREEYIIKDEIKKLINKYNYRVKAERTRIKYKNYKKIQDLQEKINITARQLIDIIINPHPVEDNVEGKEYRMGKKVLELRISLFENQKFKGKKVVRF